MTNSNENYFEDHVNSAASVSKFLVHCINRGSSDIILQTGHPAIGLISGVNINMTRYRFQPDQIFEFLRLLKNNDSIRSALAGGKDFDMSFSIEDKDKVIEETRKYEKHRFRANVSGIASNAGQGVQAVFRHIPSNPPTLVDVSFPSELYDEVAIQQGAFLIAGGTGSGKTTTFAACLRHILEGNTHIKGNIVTYEAPIEFMFDEVNSPGCIVAQSEIGEHFESFSDGVRNAMRRKPSLIVIGEMRDEETIRAAVEAANTGHPVFGTIHASDSTMILQRMIARFDASEKTQAYTDAVTTSRLLMSQSLVPRIGGGRVCLRDWIILDPLRQERLLELGYSKHAPQMREWINSGINARSMRKSIEAEFEAGTINAEIKNLSLKGYGYV